MYDTLVVISLTIISLIILNYLSGLNANNKWQIWKTNRINQLWSAAHKSIVENNLLQAERNLLTILNLDPANPAAYNRIGVLYAKQKEYVDAAHCFKAAYNLQPNVSSIHNLGLVYYTLEKYEQASVALKQAIDLDSKSAIRYVEYAKALEQLNRTEEMIESLETAADLEPKPEILEILIKTYNTYNMTAKARAIEEQLKIMIKPSSHQDHLQRPNTTIA